MDQLVSQKAILSSWQKLADSPAGSKHQIEFFLDVEVSNFSDTEETLYKGKKWPKQKIVNYKKLLLSITQ